MALPNEHEEPLRPAVTTRSSSSSSALTGFRGASGSSSGGGSGVICPSGCSGRGACSATGSCECASGFGGAGCELTSAALPMCHSVRSSVPRGRWAYFHFDVAAPAPLAPSASAAGAGAGAPLPAPLPLPSVRVQLQSLSGQPDLYVSRGRLPTLQERALFGRGDGPVRPHGHCAGSKPHGRASIAIQ